MAENLEKKADGEGAPDPKKAEAATMDLMIKHGLSESPKKPDGEKKPDGTPAEPKPDATVQVDGKEVRVAEVLAQVKDLQSKLSQLSGEEAQQNKVLTTKLTDALTALTKKEPEQEEEFVPSEAEIASFKEDMDKRAAEDYAGTTMDLARGVVKAFLQPLTKKITELEDKLKKRDEDDVKVKTEEDINKRAMGNIRAAFSEAKLEVNLDIWDKAVVFYKNTFGINLADMAKVNPDGLKKQLVAYIRTVKPSAEGEGDPKLKGSPAGGGSHQEGKDLSDGEKSIARMKRFGLV